MRIGSGTFDVLACEWSLQAANGATASRTCRVDGCTTVATGIFDNSLPDGLPFRPLADSVVVYFIIQVAERNDQRYEITGRLDATPTRAADGQCPTGFRVGLTFAGPLPHLGYTTGTYSYCE